MSNERKEVFTVVERETENEGVKSWWTRVGTAFVNRDGSINVFLDALPVNGKLQIRDVDESKRQERSNGGGARREERAGHARYTPPRGAR